LKIIFSIINLILFTTLIAALAGSYLSPEQHWYLAFFALTFPFIFTFNLLALIFQMFLSLFSSKKTHGANGAANQSIPAWKKLLIKPYLLPLIGLLISFHSASKHFRLWQGTSIQIAEKQDDCVRIMSFNVRLFDVYKWSQHKDTKDRILQLIADYQPDILCLQEIYYELKPDYISLKQISKKTALPYVHVENSVVHHNNYCFGIATFSKFPILHKARIPFSQNTDNLAIYTDLKINDDTLRVFNMHLESIRFRNEDYETLKSITGVDDKVNLKGERRILGRMKRAYIERSKQADFICEEVTKSPFKILLAGDFNDTPGSYVYTKISSTLSDAFLKHGRYSGSTYVSKIPFMRIDYLLYDKKLDCKAYSRANVVLSDHFPIIAEYQLP
jgi:endonuclease/exonuclease/phosphatase family metal-dependent hydrolase